MNVTCEVNDYSTPTLTMIRIYNHWCEHDKVEIEVDGTRHVVIGEELKRAIDNAMNVR